MCCRGLPPRPKRGLSNSPRRRCRRWAGAPLQRECNPHAIVQRRRGGLRGPPSPPASPPRWVRGGRPRFAAYHWGQSKWKGSGKPHGAAGLSRGKSRKQGEEGASAASTGLEPLDLQTSSSSSGETDFGSSSSTGTGAKSGCGRSEVAQVGEGESLAGSQAVELVLASESSSSKVLGLTWPSARLWAHVDCFLALGFLSRDPFGRPTFTGCRCIERFVSHSFVSANLSPSLSLSLSRSLAKHKNLFGVSCTCSNMWRVACSSDASTLTTIEVTDVHVRPFQTSRIVFGLTPYTAANRVLVLFFLFIMVVEENGLNSAR